jgi:ribosomal protein L12E/L44/L45/RPP1/RPP2
MSNMTTYTAIAASWIGSAGAAITGFIRHAKKVESQVGAYAEEAKMSIDSLLTELQKINNAVTALQAKPAASRAPSRKVTEAPAPKPRRAGR